MYQLEVGATRFVSNQMKGSYESSYMNCTLNFDQTC